MFYDNIELSDMYKFLFEATNSVTERKIKTIIIGDNNNFSKGGHIETVSNLGHRVVRLEFTKKGDVKPIDGGLRQDDLESIQAKWKEFLNIEWRQRGAHEFGLLFLLKFTFVSLDKLFWRIYNIYVEKRSKFYEK